MSSSVPAYSYHGRPQGDYRLSAISGARLAAASGPYIGRGNKCVGNEDTCEGMRAKGTEFCMGHLRKMAKDSGLKAEKSQEVENDAPSENDTE